jgi:hypothetical protein
MRGASGSGKGAEALGDRRAYLQRRVALYALVVTVFFAAGAVIGVLVNLGGGRRALSTEDVPTFAIGPDPIWWTGSRRRLWGLLRGVWGETDNLREN